MKRILTFFFAPTCLALVIGGCSPSGDTSVPGPNSPPPAGAADIDADKLAEIERARIAAEAEGL